MTNDIKEMGELFRAEAERSAEEAAAMEAFKDGVDNTGAIRLSDRSGEEFIPG